MKLRPGRMPDRRLALLEQEDGEPCSGESYGREDDRLGAREARARVELNREWREAFGVPLSDSITDETAEVQSSDLLDSSDSDSERTPITKPSPLHAILPPGLPEQEH